MSQDEETATLLMCKDIRNKSMLMFIETILLILYLELSATNYSKFS